MTIWHHMKGLNQEKSFLKNVHFLLIFIPRKIFSIVSILHSIWLVLSLNLSSTYWSKLFFLTKTVIQLWDTHISNKWTPGNFWCYMTRFLSCIIWLSIQCRTKSVGVTAMIQCGWLTDSLLYLCLLALEFCGGWEQRQGYSGWDTDGDRWGHLTKAHIPTA